MRIVFCPFADDTGIFEPRDIFLEFIESRTREDGTDLGLWLSQLFQVLVTPETKRLSTLDEDFVQFPMSTATCATDRCASRPSTLLCALHCWMSAGSTERRAQHVHFTTEKNNYEGRRATLHG